MKLYKISIESTETLKKISERVGAREFYQKEVSDLVPSDHFLRQMENKGHVIRGPVIHGGNIRAWKLSDHALAVLGGTA